MKLYTLILVSAVIGLSACGKKSDSSNSNGDGGNNGGGQVAITPQPDCYANGTCQQGYYPNSWVPSYYTGNQNWYTYDQGQFCGCPVNTVPVMNNYAGFACVPSSYVRYGQNYAYAGQVYQNSQWVNTPQMYYNSGYDRYPRYYDNDNFRGPRGRQTTCQSAISYSCSVDRNDCQDPNMICRPLNGGGSRMGICQYRSQATQSCTTQYSYNGYGSYYRSCSNNYQIGGR